MSELSDKLTSEVLRDFNLRTKTYLEMQFMIIERDLRLNKIQKVKLNIFRDKITKGIINVKKQTEKELLVDFFMFFRDNGERYLGLTIEQLVDKYLQNNKPNVKKC